MTFSHALTVAMGQPNQRPLKAAVITYNQYDLAIQAAEALLNGTRVPDEVVIVDNGCLFVSPFGDRVTVLRPPFNLGYAGGINHFCDYAGTDVDCMILNDDLIVGRMTVELAGAAPGWFVMIEAFGCFIMRPAVREHVGPWGNEYWPMGPEDQDYRWRLHLAAPDIGPFGCSGGIVISSKEDCQHVDGGHKTVLSIGEWSNYFRDRNNRLLARRWGPSTSTNGDYLFTHKVPYGGVVVDELELFVKDSILEGRLSADEANALRGLEVIDMNGDSPYLAAAAVLYSPGATLTVSRPFCDEWPIVWALAGSRLNLVIA